MSRSAVLFVVFTFAFFVSPQASAQSKQDKEKKEVTIIGEVIDTACYIKGGFKGIDHKDCVVACAKAGIPLAILEDGTGNVYFTAAPKDMVGTNDMLIKYAAEKVKITGRMYERGGVKLLAINMVERVN